MKPFDNAWTVIKMPQMQVTPEDYDEFGERFRMNMLDQILEQDPAQNLTGVNVPQRRGMQQNMYLPMQTDVPLSQDTMGQLRDEGFTVTNRVHNDGGRLYNFRTKANPIDYEDATGNLGTDFDQRSRQPLDVRGQLESSAALARRGAFAANNEYAHDEYYEPRPDSVRPEREQLMRLLHGASDEQVQSILDADQARTARAIGATRGMRGGKHGSEFARTQARELIEEKIRGPERKQRNIERAKEAAAKLSATTARMQAAIEERRKREEEERQRIQAERKANRIPIPSSKVEPGSQNQVRRRPVRVKPKRRFGTTRGGRR